MFKKQKYLEERSCFLVQTNSFLLQLHNFLKNYFLKIWIFFILTHSTVLLISWFLSETLHDSTERLSHLFWEHLSGLYRGLLQHRVYTSPCFDFSLSEYPTGKIFLFNLVGEISDLVKCHSKCCPIFFSIWNKNFTGKESVTFFWSPIAYTLMQPHHLHQSDF